uniref:XRN 5'-3' exonuclease-like protein n=1 Tax=Megaviridae environmental sample TaxID=1737588 RepID=A0A5J6VJL0_9VIRU|nr:MAG: XRN 5'-3' exonuclease-like protein [Megaviridae environmental sample]
MGVPGFFAQLIKRYGDRILDTNFDQVINYLMLDANCFLHPTCLHVLKENPNASIKVLENKMLTAITEYLDVLIDTVKPQELLYIAVDGVAPMAKIKQQRMRRYKTVKDTNNIKELSETHNELYKSPKWSNISITPGTEFMGKITAQINTYIQENQKRWQDIVGSTNLKVIFSSANTPGEGEHKILQYLKDGNVMEFMGGSQEDKHIVIYGLDADLIFLSLALERKNMYLLRESSIFMSSDEPFTWVRIDELRRCIVEMFYDFGFTPDYPNTKAVVRDYIFLCYLIGNDFLPNIPSVDIRHQGIDILLKTYIESFRGHYLVQPNGGIKLGFFKAICKGLAEYEEPTLRKRWAKSKRKKVPPHGSPYEQASWNFENLNFEIDDKIRLGSDTPRKWNRRYYEENFNRFFSDTKKSVPRICQEYIKGLFWITKYYFDQVVSWDWWYPYDHAPLAVSLAWFLDNEMMRKIRFEISEPVTPYGQLLMVIPPSKSDILPAPFNTLFQDEQLEDILVEDFEMDYIMKQKEYQGIPILPPFNVSRVRTLISEKMKHLEAKSKRAKRQYKNMIDLNSQVRDYVYL